MFCSIDSRYCTDTLYIFDILFLIPGIEKTTDRVVNITETVRLDCGSSSWLFKPESYSESEELSVDGRRHTLELRMTAVHEVSTVLTIHRLVPADSGVYSCIRANDVQQYVLHVLESPGWRWLCFHFVCLSSLYPQDNSTISSANAEKPARQDVLC